MKTVSKKFFTSFLPFIENYFAVCNMMGNEAIFNKQMISSYLQTSYQTIIGFFNKAESEGLIKFIKKTRTFDDEIVTNWAMNVYLVDLQKVFDLINLVVPYQPTTEERVINFSKYCEFARLTNLGIDKLKEHDEKNKYYQTQNVYYTGKLTEVNELRPELLQSSYLLQGCNREFNLMCKTRNPEKHPEHQERYELIHKLLDFSIIDYWDAKASIYRVAYALNHKELLPEDVDIYEEIWFRCKFTKPLTTYREDYKLILMPIFMSDGTKNGYWSVVCKENYTIKRKTEREAREALLRLSTYLGITVRELLDTTYEALKQFIGTDKLEGGSIFIPESNVHILMQNELWKNGYRSINVYDCTYFDGTQISKQEVAELHNKALSEVVSRKAI